MKLDTYIANVASEIATGVNTVREMGINITPHLHQDIRVANTPLAYGNSKNLLIPVEIEVGLDENGEVSGRWWLLGFLLGFKRRHRAKVNFWLEPKEK